MLAKKKNPKHAQEIIVYSKIYHEEGQMARSSRANVRRKDDKKKRKNHIEAAR